MIRKSFWLILPGLLMLAPNAFGTLVPVDFSAFQNYRMQNRFPAAPEGNVVLAGVPFDIPVGGFNEWTPFGVGENFNPIYNGVVSIDIPVGISGVKTAYTLANTWWGVPSSGLTLVEFFGSGGAYYSRVLVGDSDIRDWNAFPGFTTIINGVTTVTAFEYVNGRDNNPDYIDMQIYNLPTEFLTQELTTIRITDHRTAGINAAILTGITVNTVPEPATWLLIGSGLIAAGLFRRKAPRS